jgi:competence protein ComFC
MKHDIKIRKMPAVFLDLILPQECLGCGLSKTWLCDDCYKQIPFNQSFPCLVCHRPTLQGSTHKECTKETSLDGILIASWRTDLLKDLVHSFKYENLKILAPQLAEIISRKIDSSPLVANLFLSQKTLLIPVPLFKSREWDRGYNQAELLARELIENSPVQLAGDLIRRTRNTTTQTDLPRHKRLKNIQHAFEVIASEKIKNKSIILVDDVTTTGATISEIARVLKQAKAKEVWGLVLARG